MAGDVYDRTSKITRLFTATIPSVNLDHLALSESGFLFDARSGATYSLSATGTTLLRALIDDDAESGGAGLLGVDALVECVVDKFEVAPAVARRDVAQFLFRVRDLGLIPAVNRAGGGA